MLVQMVCCSLNEFSCLKLQYIFQLQSYSILSSLLSWEEMNDRQSCLLQRTVMHTFLQKCVFKRVSSPAVSLKGWHEQILCDMLIWHCNGSMLHIPWEPLLSNMRFTALNVVIHVHSLLESEAQDVIRKL